MIARGRAQHGFTIIEVMVAMALTTMVLGISVGVFTSMWDEHRTTTLHNEAQDAVRMTTDRLARNLRNLASPTALRNVRENRPRAVELAEPYQFVFRTVDEKPLPTGSENTANLMRMRYCLDVTSRDNQRLYMQTQRWTSATPPAVPDTTSCPGTGWATSQQVAANIVNARDPAVPRPLFSYNSTNVEQITQVHTDVFVDPTPGVRPAEARVVSGVYLRNQNQFPVAGFVITTIDPVNRLVRFDGSASVDPEGQSLRYCWYLDPPASVPDCSQTPAHSSFLGEGVVFSYTMPAGTHNVVLRVEDQAGLRDDEVVRYP